MPLNTQSSESVDADEGSRAPRSQLACNACRRKKTKCDRFLPSCRLCTKLQQGCVYPTLRLKPGPKSDSSQRLQRKLVMNGARRKSNRKTSCRKDHVNYEKDDGCDFNLRDEDQSSEPGVDTGPRSFDAQSDSTEVESNFVKAISLSSLIHPTHDPCLPPVPIRQDTVPSSSLLNLVGAQTLLMDACNAFGLSLEAFQHLSDLYFDTMNDFSLFHRPSFEHKIQTIKNTDHFQALFASMFAYSASFYIADAVDPHAHLHTSSWKPDPMRFHNKALTLINKSLDEYLDQPPSLCLLQAMILITSCELTKGVRGRAWRLLGSCVRVAYELHLHLIDYEACEEYFKVGRDLSRWIADEERRRCWWAIWKMDNFASVIRRCPTAIDWSMIDTYLPVSDELWFNNQFQQSCFLERAAIARVEILKSCGNESPDAWLIVISSIMRDAQVLLRGNLRGVLLDVDPHNSSDQLLHYFRNSFSRKSHEDSRQLKLLIRALQTATSNLPTPLVYDGEYLDFGFDYSEGLRDSGVRKLHSAKYNIFLSMKLAQFMIYHHYAFGEIVSGTIFSGKERGNNPGPLLSDQQTSKEAQGLRHCLQAADDIYTLISRCAEDHFKCVSPFLASTVWLSASLQVLRKLFGKREDLDETLSKYAILRAACEQFTAFWHTPLALLENLDSLEDRLSRYCNTRPRETNALHNVTHSSNMSSRIAGNTGVRTSNIWGDRSKPLQDLCPPWAGTDDGSSPSSRFHIQPGVQPEHRNNENSQNDSITSNLPLPYDYKDLDKILTSGQYLATGAQGEDTGSNPELNSWFSHCLSEFFSGSFDSGSFDYGRDGEPSHGP